MRFGWISWLLAVPLALTPHASEPTKSHAEPFPYSRTVWRVGAGLPEDIVQAVTQSSDGSLWLGTTGGLAVFDGARIKPYDTGKAQLSSNSYFSLTRDHSGTLWAGSEGGGLLRIGGPGQTRAFSSASGLADGFVRVIYEDSRSRLWVGTDGGLFLRQGDKFVRWEDPAAASVPAAIHSITEDRDHRIWVGGSRLFSIDGEGREQDYTLPGADSQNRVKCIRQTADGTIWVGTVGGLDRLRSGHFETVPGINYTVRTMLQSSDGALWVGTIGGGLWQIRAGQPVQISRPELLPSQTVLAIFEDDQRQIWIGTQAGLVRLNRTAVELVALPEAGDPDFETISGDDHGTIWVAAQKPYMIQDGVAHAIDPLHDPDVKIRNLFRDHAGNLWVGTDGSGVYEVPAASPVRHISAPEQLTNNFVRGFMQTHDGALWVACDEGVNVLGPHGWRKITEADGLAYFSIRSMLESRDGSVWIGTDRGLSLWREGRFVHNAVTEALASEKVWSILQDTSGSMWFGTRDHGIFGLTAHGVVRRTTASGLPSNSVFQLLEDRSRRVWMSGPNTIASVSEAALNALDADAQRPLGVRVYSMPFGGDGGQLYGGRQPSGYLAPDDTVWFPTTRGAAHIRASLVSDAPAPRGVLESVTEDGQSVSVRDGRLAIPARVSRVAFDFSAIFLRPQEGLRFRYQLEPFDKGWTLASSNRTATYTNLPARHYRFRVVSFDLADPDKSTEVDVEVSKTPFFYQTWWFYLVAAIVVGGLVWMIYQSRLRQVRKRFAAVMEERSRLAREMHDTVVQGCVGVSTLLEAVAVTPAADVASREELLAMARRQAQSTIRDARDVVWDMRHEDESDVDLVAALRGLVTQASAESEVRISFNSNFEKLILRASASHELLMLAREAMNNALQHSRSESIDLSLQTQEETLLVVIQDHGTGFDAASTDMDERHYGILGMRERAERLGGTFALTSAAGQGTEVLVTVPLRALQQTVSRRHPYA